jgi:death on curing protein
VLEPFWIDEQIVRVMHDDQIEEHGGSFGIRDEHLLSASLARPQHLFAYGESPSIFDLAAAYGYGLAINHPFIDGNKRTAFVTMATFLELNSYSLETPELEVVLKMERLAGDEENQESIALWLQDKSIPT